MEFDLNTTGDVIDELGGNQAVGNLTGTNNPKAVSNWRISNRFPAWTYLILTKALGAIGKSAPETLWKMEAPEKPKRLRDGAAA